MQAVKTVRLESLPELIEREVDRIPNERVYYAMKRMHLKHILPQTVETMELCLAAHKLGFFITTKLIAELQNISSITVLSKLHTLGDKKCLILVRGGSRTASRWVVSATFIKHYEETSK